MSDIITEEIFDEMLLHRNSRMCPGRQFYIYDDFISAATAFPTFGTTGDIETRKREIAAFLGLTSLETSG